MHLAPGQINFIAPQASTDAATAAAADNLLLTKITQATPGMHSLLAGIYAVESISEALQLAKTLQSHEAVVTRDGLYMGPSWLQYNSKNSEDTGVLKREQDLKTLQQGIQQQTAVVEQLQENFRKLPVEFKRTGAKSRTVSTKFIRNQSQTSRLECPITRATSATRANPTTSTNFNSRITKPAASH